jgi:hypothetical protein
MLQKKAELKIARLCPGRNFSVHCMAYIYTVTLKELKAVLKASTIAGKTKTPRATGIQPTQEECFQEVRRRKWHSTEEAIRTP